MALPLFLFLAAALVAPVAAEQQPHDTLPGFRANNAFESRGIDNINLFSGDVGIAIPLGPEYPLGPGNSWQLKAYYSAKFWKFDTSCNDMNPEDQNAAGVQHAYVSGYPTLGAGWTLELGYVNEGAIDQVHSGVYRSPDGGSHPFSTLPTPAGAFLTSDTTHLRVRRIPPTGTATSWEVDFPDGTTQIFGRQYFRPRPLSGESYDFNDLDWDTIKGFIGAPVEGPRFGLTQIRDSFGSVLLTVDYGSPWRISRINLNPGTAEARSIVYNWRTEQVGGSTGPVWEVLDSIDFPMVGGQLLTVKFSFEANPQFLRNTYDNSPGYGSAFGGQCVNPGTVFVPMLDTIAFRSGANTLGEYSFDYIRNDTGQTHYRNGLLTRVTLPTKGTVAYTYDRTASVRTSGPGCPNLETDSCAATLAPDAGELRSHQFQKYWDRSATVVQRTETDPFAGVSSTVTYDRLQVVPSAPHDPTVPDDSRIGRRTVVDEPAGGGARKTTKYVFHVAGIELDFGSGIELVRRYYADSDFSGTPIRTHINCHGSGSTAVCGYTDSSGAIKPYYLGANTQRQKEVVWYGVNPPGGESCVADTTLCSQTEHSEYHDQAMKYRKTTVSGTVPGMTGWSSRFSRTEWAPVIDATHWLLNLYTAKSTTDQGTTLPTPSSTSASFVFGSNGFLNSSTQADGATRTLTKTYTNDGRGNPATERIQGSGTSLDGDFTDTRTFQTGLPRSTQRTGISWKSFDATRDAATGLITKSRDPNASLETSYSYDVLGRLTQITPPTSSTTYPQKEMDTRICYQPAAWNGTSGTPALVIVKRGSADPCIRNGGTPAIGSGTFEAYQYDGFGRVARQVRRFPNSFSGGSYFARQETRYDDAGQQVFVSEWSACPAGASGTSVDGCLSPIPYPASPGPGTTWSNFDPFGRPRQITKADGTATTISFADGAITHSDTLESVTVTVGTTPATAKTRRDLLGRIVSVEEPLIGATPDITDYRYDVSDKLFEVKQGDQTRTFTYDAFGNLRSEQTPEVVGTINYALYNALGNLKEKTDPFTTTRYAYDLAGRLLTVDTTEGTGRRYLQNVWDSAAGFPSGKLGSRTATNYAVSPVATVVDTYAYSGVGGRVSSQTTVVSGVGNPLSTSQKWHYNDLGLTAAHYHPRGSTGLFVVTTEYSSGLPVRLTANGLPVVTSALYQPSGGLARYVTGNNTGKNVTTTIETPPSLMARPHRFVTTGASANFDSGVYVYDGAGNISSIGGGDQFLYDARSRLTSALHADASGQGFIYDRYGNLTRKGSTSYTVAAATNRVTSNSAGYDTRGNMLRWGNEFYSWDGVGRQIRHQAPAIDWKYLYDGSDERLVKLPMSGTGLLYSFRDEGNRVATEFLDAAVQRDNVYLGTQLVGSYAQCAPGWLYYSSDHLGTPRLVTNPVGQTVESRKYRPFGEELSGPATSQIVRFASMERDVEASRYYDHARSHDFSLGRFLSIDPINGKPGGPQGWNRYAYAQANPLKFVDPDGRVLILAGSQAAQRRLEAVANAALFGQRLVLSASGRAALAPTGIQGPPSPAQAGLARLLGRAISHSATVSFSLSENSPSTIVGSFYGADIDVADVSAIGEGPAFSAAGAFAHEIGEQLAARTLGITRFEGGAHRAGLIAESHVTGYSRVGEISRSTGLGSAQITLHYSRGTQRVDVVVTIVNGNVVSVRRIPRV